MAYIFNSTLNTRPILENSLRFIRSDVPVKISQQEKEYLISKDITTIIDLRTAKERAQKECPLAKDERFRYYCMPVTGENAVPPSVERVSESYINMVDDQMHKIIDLALSAKSNVLYFCNAGKDRTGVVSAILLYKSGKSREYITADYMKSKENLKPLLEDYAKKFPEIDFDVITPHERYIKEFLQWLTANSKS